MVAFALIAAAWASALLLCWIFLPPHSLFQHPDFFPSVVSNPDLANVREPRDRALTLITLVAPFMIVPLLHLHWNVPRHLTDTVVAVVGGAATGLVVWAMAWRDHRGLVSIWPGFQLPIVLALAALAVIVVPLARRLPDPWVRRVPALGAATLGLVYLPLLLSTPHGTLDTYNARFTINELLAPAAGSFPLGRAVPQYVTLLGYPIAPVVRLLPGDAIQITQVWVTLLQVLTLVAAGIVVHRVCGRRWLPLAAFAVIPATFVHGIGASRHFSVAGYWAVYPLRLVFPMVLAAVLARPPSVWTRKFCLLVGGLIGATALNNAEFGVPAAGAALLVAAAAAECLGVALRRSATIVVAAAGVFLAYAVALTLGGSPVDMGGWLAFSRIFGGTGFSAIPMLAWGLHTVVLLTFIASVAIGLATAPLFQRRYGVHLPEWASLLYLGVFGLGASLYFMNRSLVAVLMALLLPWSLTVTILLRMVWRETAPWVQPRQRVRRVLARAPLSLLSVGFATLILNGPVPSWEVGRLMGHYPDRDFVAQSALVARAEGLQVAASAETGVVGVLAADDSLLALLTGFRPVTGFNHPGSIVTFSQASHLCPTVRAADVDVVMIEKSGLFPEALEALAQCTSELRDRQSFYAADVTVRTASGPVGRSGAGHNPK